MNEVEARDWIADRYPASALHRLDRFVALLEREAVAQSLIARSTVPAIWSRHILDSAQLATMGPATGAWLDIGSGGGLPGIVVAILRDAPIVLSEPRRKRAEFLSAVVASLGIAHSTVVTVKAQLLTTELPFSVVSARAVGSISDIFTWTSGIVSRETLFILPRGQSGMEELEFIRHAWHGRFHVEQSLTDFDSVIVVASGVAKR